MSHVRGAKRVAALLVVGLSMSGASGYAQQARIDWLDRMTRFNQLPDDQKRASLDEILGVAGAER